MAPKSSGVVPKKGMGPLGSDVNLGKIVRVQSDFNSGRYDKDIDPILEKVFENPIFWEDLELLNKNCAA